MLNTNKTRSRTKIAVLLLVFASALVSITGRAETIDVSKHGITPGADVTYRLNRLIESIGTQNDVTLFFPKGRYDFYPENAIERYRAIANHDNGLKRLGFPLFDCNNITIDGSSSEFVFHGRMVPIVLDRVDGAKLKNFSIDWVRSFHAELEVVERDDSKKSFVVKADPKLYPYSIADGKILFERFGQQDPIGSNIVFDPKTSAPTYRTRQYSVNSKKAIVARAGEGRFRIENAVKVAPPVGNVLVVYGVHPTSRLCPAIHITNSSDVEIENVTVYEAGGMALIVERTENVSLDGMVVTSTKDRFAATRADATHFIGCKGTIRLENCLFEHMLDDGINVHGAYVKVAEYLGDGKFICEISHFQQWGLTFAEPGDQVAMLSRKTVLPFYETTVKSIRQLNEHRFVMTVSSVPDKLPDGPLSVENLTWYPDLVMRNNTIRQNRARSVLVTTKGNVVIENNYFSSQMHGILIEGDNNKWYESGAVNDVTIRNNRFENIGFSGEEAYPLIASPLLTPEQKMGEGHYHRNVRFVGNKVKSFNGHLVLARSVQGLKIVDNVIEKSTTYPELKEYPAIQLQYCDDVSIRGNEASGFNRTLELTRSNDTTNVTIDSNRGFEE